MYERCISCSIVWGRMRAPGSCWAPSGMVHLDVEVHDVPRVLLDVLPTGADGFAHQNGEEGVCRGRVLNCNLLQDATLRVQGRFPELVRVHLPEALVPLVGHALVPELLRELLPLLLCVCVEDFLGFSNLIEGRLGDVHIPCVNEGSHVPEEECKEKRRDMLAIHIGIGHCYILVIS